MYRTSRVYIKTALAYLVAAVLAGGLLLVNQAWALDTRVWALLPVYYHLLTVGWLTQLIAGVALWLFPPLSREQPRGNDHAGWLAYGLLNSGLLLRAVAEPWHSWRPQPLTGWALVVSALAQVGAVWLIVILLWPRVRGRAGRAEPVGGKGR